jgi:hypothetical protein
LPSQQGNLARARKGIIACIIFLIFNFNSIKVNKSGFKVVVLCCKNKLDSLLTNSIGSNLTFLFQFKCLLNILFENKINKFFFCILLFFIKIKQFFIF